MIWRQCAGVPGGAAILAVHAGRGVPPGVDLPPAALDAHVGHDLGTEALALALGRRLRAPVMLAGVSRLVADLNRDEADPTLAPEQSDGWQFPANRLDGERRTDRVALHRAFHAEAARWLAAQEARLLVDVHSFTPMLAARPHEARPWPLALLVNRDRRAADAAAAVWRGQASLGGPLGWNEPYSGERLNHVLVRHGERPGRGVLAIEVRQDRLVDDTGVEAMAGLVAAGVLAALEALR